MTFPVTCQVIFLYIGIFQTNWIRKESMIAFSLAKYRPLLAAEIYVPTLIISGQRFSSWNRTKVASTLPNGFRNQRCNSFSLATEKYIYLVFNIY
jgi:hypothetical protein